MIAIANAAVIEEVKGKEAPEDSRVLQAPQDQEDRPDRPDRWDHKVRTVNPDRKALLGLRDRVDSREPVRSYPFPQVMISL